MVVARATAVQIAGTFRGGLTAPINGGASIGLGARIRLSLKLGDHIVESTWTMASLS